MILSGEDIISFVSRDWDTQWGTQEHITSRLANTNRVLVIEPLISPLALLRYPYLWKRAVNSLRGIRRKGGLFLLTPFMVLSFANALPFIERINRQIVFSSIRRAIKRLGFNVPISLVYSIWAHCFAGRLNEKMVIYYSVDEVCAYESKPQKRKIVRKKVRELCEKADIVFTTATTLYESRRRYNRNTFFLPNAADVEHFMKALSDATDIPDSMRKLKHPVIGFVGMIGGERFDGELILYLVKRHPEWSMVLVGGVKRDFVARELLIMLRNVHFMGMQELEALPNFMKAFDVCIIPYAVTEEVKNIYPLKLHEYLSTGKPVVATDMPELYPFRDVVRISKDYNEFEKNIMLSLNEDGKSVAPRLKIARQNTWENRIELMSEIINEINIQKAL